jgi:hypothetical protein
MLIKQQFKATGQIHSLDKIAFMLDAYLCKHSSVERPKDATHMLERISHRCGKWRDNNMLLLPN